ncbi:glycosyltransferase family 4 protein [Geotalea toluenoxydans]|uniref:glycosyltransferase family 4 protein n=1 Tax=Geotalea toluenoxydans TaxID=421624 RepID=UPI001FB38DA7|nr:glycosyltransferase family 4 protein [Geotalea toluenoxydans]
MSTYLRCALDIEIGRSYHRAQPFPCSKTLESGPGYGRENHLHLQCVAEDKFRLANDRNNPPAALPQGEIILHVGSFEKIKGQDVLLHAFKHVLQVHSDCRLLLVGRSGSFLPEVETICADLEIAHAVSIMKDVAPERIPQLMANAMFVVLPSRYEGGVPLVLLEAGAVKKAVVASDAGGIAELITPGRNGLLVPPDNPQALAQAMLNLLDDRQLMQEMGGKLYDTIAGAFSWKTTACRYLELAMK